MCWENIQIYVVHISIKCIESMHSYSCPSSPLETPGKTLRIFCFPLAERGGQNHDLLYENSIGKREDNLEH